MNDLKFRVWNDNEMFYSMPHFEDIDPLNLSDLLIPTYCQYLMQYTGLKDVSGVEIYSGDIVTAIERNQGQKEGYLRKEQVYLFPGGFKLFGRPMVEFTTQDDNETIKNCMWRTSNSSNDFIYLELIDFKVIGNIYENPDLI